jgi:hypothetical protein
MLPQKYKKLYPGIFLKKRGKGIRSAPMLSFLKKYSGKRNWHIICIIKSKSKTLISFLLKKVYFVPQSRPFSIMAFGLFSFLVPGVY